MKAKGYHHICEVAANKNELSCWCIHMLLCLVVECRKVQSNREVCWDLFVVELKCWSWIWWLFTLRFSLWFRDVSPWLFRVSLTKRQGPGTFVWYRVLCHMFCLGQWFIAQQCARCIYIIWIWTGMSRSKQATWKCNMLNVQEKVLLLERSCYWAQVDGIYRWLVYGLLTFQTTSWDVKNSVIQWTNYQLQLDWKIRAEWTEGTSCFAIAT